jgi:hypothetical protein
LPAMRAERAGLVGRRPFREERPQKQKKNMFIFGSVQLCCMHLRHEMRTTEATGLAAWRVLVTLVSYC